MQNQTDIFNENGLTNIFDGAVLINEAGHKKVIGYRLENPNSENCFTFSRSPMDTNGIYSATGFIRGIKRKNRNQQNAFFPKDWTQEQIVTAITEAYETRETKIGQDLILGTTSSGLKIRLWLDENGKVFDAMPLINNELAVTEKKPKKKNACKICQQPKHSVCVNHNNLPRPKISALIWKRMRYHLKKIYFNLVRTLRFVE
jgi:Bacterial EndoU nuclease